MNNDTARVDPLAGVNEDRRRFLKTILAGSTLAVPVVVSMTLTGASRAPQAPGVSGATSTGATTSGTTTTVGTTPTPTQGTTPSPDPTDTTPPVINP